MGGDAPDRRRATLAQLDRLLSILAMAFVSSDFIFQKYFDPSIPLLLALARTPGEALGLRDRLAYAVLLGAGALYFVVQARPTVF